MKTVVGELRTEKQVKAAIMDLDQALQRLTAVLQPLMNSTGSLVFLVKNADGTYGIREIAIGGTLTLLDSPSTSTLTISD